MLTGCTFAGSVDNLLSPPVLSEDQKEIYRALQDSAGQDIKLQYPKSGSYRSAIIIEDIDNDGTSEAMAFYSRTNDSSADGSIRVNVLDKDTKGWRSVYDHAATASGIDRVLFPELNTDGIKNIIIGYNMPSGEKTLKAYSYSSGVLSATYTDSYSSVFVSDMDKNNVKDLVVIHPNNEYTGKQAYISLVSDKNGSLYEKSTILLNDKTSDFVNIVTGYVGGDTPAVFIDGMAGGQLSTEIIYCINGTLRNPLYLSESGIIEDTVRPTGYLSVDIDSDGIIEIPTLGYFPGYSRDSREQFRITYWSVFDNYEIKKKYSSYYNVPDGYCFIIPNRWDGVVTAKTDSSTGDIVFCKYAGSLLGSTEELMRIAAVTSEYRDERLSNGYTLIKSKDNISYLYKVPEKPNEPLILTSTEITNSFYLMV